MTDIDTLQAKRRSLNAQIRVARKQAEAANKRHLGEATREIGAWVLQHLFGDADAAQIDSRVGAAKSALAEPRVADFLRQVVRVGPAAVASDDDQRGSDGGGHHAA
jgi:hypothetical protein